MVRRRAGRSSGPGGGAAFWVALGVAALLTAVLVGLLGTPAWEGAAAGAAYGTLLWALRVWAALAWGVVIVTGLRRLRRR